MNKQSCIAIRTSPLSRGFSILEMLLSISIIALIGALATPVFQSFQNRSDLNVAVGALAQNARRAQVLALGNTHETNWGVSVSNGEILMFSGTSSTTRNSQYDEIFAISPSLTITGQSEFIFNKTTGLVSATGTVTLTSVNNESRNLSINRKGIIDY